MDKDYGLWKFTEDMAGIMQEELSKEWEGVTCCVYEAKKNNGAVRAGIKVNLPDKQISPVIYTGDYYDRIKMGDDLDSVMESMEGTVRRMLVSAAEKENCGWNDLSNFEKFRDMLSMRLINTKANREELKNLPHRTVEDLSLIFTIVTTDEERGGMESVKISYSLMEQWGMKEEELYRAAMENMGKKEVPVLEDMLSHVQNSFLGTEGENLLSGTSTEKTGTEFFGILTNGRKMDGAAMLVYPGLMERIRDMIPGDFYILPSSIHETLILTKDCGMKKEEAARMVKEINKNVLEREDFLSNNIYEYDRERGKICRVEMEERQKERER